MKRSLAISIAVSSVVCVTASAEPALNYSIDHVTPGYSVRLIESGYVLGGLKTPTRPVIPDDTSDPKKVLQHESGERAKEVEVIQSATREQHRELVEKLGTTAAMPASQAAAGPAISAPSLGKPDLASFSTCARRTLPKLKTALAAEVRDSAAESQRILLTMVEERGDGVAAGSTGLACGRYLGKASIQRPERLVEEIKILSALSARRGDELTRLAAALIGSQHSGAKAKPMGLWIHYWKSLAPIAALTDKPLPTFDQLDAELLALPVEKLTESEGLSKQLELRTSITPEQVREQLANKRAAGEKLAIELLGIEGPVP